MYGFTIFCDDIRDEVGGKTSFIGTYGDSLLVHGDFPFTLPKFGLRATFVADPQERPEELTLSVFLPGDENQKPSISGPIPIGTGAPPTSPDELIFAEARVLIAPLVLNCAGDIKVRFKADNQVVKAGRLRVGKFNPRD